MKPIRLRVRPLVQTDLFASAATRPSLTSQQKHYDELVDLVSQLLWEVARDADAVQHLEADDEQDQS